MYLLYLRMKVVYTVFTNVFTVFTYEGCSYKCYVFTINSFRISASVGISATRISAPRNGATPIGANFYYPLNSLQSREISSCRLNPSYLILLQTRFSCLIE